MDFNNYKLCLSFLAYQKKHNDDITTMRNMASSSTDTSMLQMKNREKLEILASCASSIVQTQSSNTMDNIEYYKELPYENYKLLFDK